MAMHAAGAKIDKLGELSDVKLTNPIYGDVLCCDGTLWKNYHNDPLFDEPVHITDSTDSTSSTSAASFQTDGGASIAKDCNAYYLHSDTSVDADTDLNAEGKVYINATALKALSGYTIGSMGAYKSGTGNAIHTDKTATLLLVSDTTTLGSGVNLMMRNNNAAAGVFTDIAETTSGSWGWKASASNNANCGLELYASAASSSFWWTYIGLFPRDLFFTNAPKNIFYRDSTNPSVWVEKGTGSDNHLTTATSMAIGDKCSFDGVQLNTNASDDARHQPLGGIDVECRKTPTTQTECVSKASLMISLATSKDTAAISCDGEPTVLRTDFHSALDCRFNKLNASSLLYLDVNKDLQNMGLGYGMTIAGTELKTPQDLQTSASPEFVNTTLSGLTANSLVGTNASKALESVSVSANLSKSGTNLDTAQGIQTSSTPTFAGITITGASDFQNVLVSRLAADSAGVIDVKSSGGTISSPSNSATGVKGKNRFWYYYDSAYRLGAQITMTQENAAAANSICDLTFDVNAGAGTWESVVFQGNGVVDFNKQSKVQVDDPSTSVIDYTTAATEENFTVPFSTENLDNHNEFTGNTWTCKYPGDYSVGANCHWVDDDAYHSGVTPNSSTYCFLDIVKNSTVVATTPMSKNLEGHTKSGYNEYSDYIGKIITMAVNDTIVIKIRNKTNNANGSGTIQTGDTAGSATNISIHKI